MPPRAKSGPDATGRASDSRSLVSTGPKDVQKHYGKRDERQREIRPTTERALVLRNGKHGVQGTGEMILMMKMTGREKLDLLAEDLVEKANKSLLTPFRMELCLKLAESQLSENLDDIANLKDPDLFFPLVEEEIKSRDASDTKRKNGTGSTGDPSYNAEIISNRIHNAYMLGSAWKIAVDLLYSLQEGGLFDESVVSTLKTDDRLRSQYLTLYDLVNTLVDLQQAKLSVLATTTPHYASYFKESVNETGEKEFFFDWQETRKACSSFLDSIIVELCFPGAPYAKAILYQILHDAIEESPRDARRFPQLLWDFVGDLSVTVQLQQILETPLLSLDGRQWKAEDRQKYDPYDRWVAAQLHSQIASDKWANLKDIISPLHRTKTKETLDAMWKIIDNNYKEACDKDIGALWGLTEVLNPKPHWHSYGLVRRGNDDDDYDDSPPKITGKAPNNLLEITSGEQTDDSMPGLAEISDSDEDVEWGDNDDKEEESDHDTDDDESGYGSDQESLMRAMVREAMNAVTAVNWQEPPDENDELDPFTAEDRKGNPFLNLLGSLRGRMFSKSSKLKTTASTNSPRAKPATSASISANRPQTGPTIEEVSDEEDDISHAKKKKKKKPKKKKKKPAAADGDAPATPDIPASPPLTSPAPAAKVQAKSPSLVKPKVAVAASQSTTSFYPLETVTTAQSARSYRQSEHIDAPKVKVKSRSAQPSIFSSTKGLLDKLGVGKEKDKDATADKKERCGWFAKLGKKTRKSMHQILNTAEDETKGMAGMKWDAFVKVLTDLGFKYDPSTAGSSVRFDPPDPRDRSISFHKPHPDSTISRVLLKEYSKKLRKYYGWDPKDIMDLS